MRKCSVPLKDKRIVVTGGGSGIGRATVEALAAEGARVLTCGRNEDTLRETQDSAREQSGGEVATVTADLSRREVLSGYSPPPTRNSAASTSSWPAPPWAPTQFTNGRRRLAPGG